MTHFTEGDTEAALRIAWWSGRVGGSVCGTQCWEKLPGAGVLGPLVILPHLQESDIQESLREPGAPGRNLSDCFLPHPVFLPAPGCWVLGALLASSAAFPREPKRGAGEARVPSAPRRVGWGSEVRESRLGQCLAPYCPLPGSPTRGRRSEMQARGTHATGPPGVSSQQAPLCPVALCPLLPTASSCDPPEPWGYGGGEGRRAGWPAHGLPSSVPQQPPWR